MSSPLLVVIGFVLLAIGIWGLLAGKIIAGAKGLRSNYYYKGEDPLLYYSFVFIYLFVGLFILYNTWSR